MQQWLVCIIKFAGQGFPKVLPCEHRLRALRNGTIKFALQWCNRAQGALLATAASLFPDPLQTANSEMLLNTADPLSSINSTINILDTFEERERQARSSGRNPSHDSMYVRQCNA